MTTALSIEHEPQNQPQTTRPTFERAADEAIAQVRKVYAQRGEGYGDTWALENVTSAVTRATLDRFGVRRLSPEQLRLLLLAALIDVKDSRLIGLWNPDSLVDGAAYRAAYLTLRDEWERGQAAAVMIRP